MVEGQTFRRWLLEEVRSVLNRRTTPPPLILWCDPRREWREVLMAVAEGEAFELWAQEEHELVLRERLVDAPPRPRVLWLPVDRDEITFLKVFELQAEMVWTEPLVSALSRFGVNLGREQEIELREMLRAYVLEHLDEPRSGWRDLTPSSAKTALVSDDLVFEAVAASQKSLREIVREDRFSVFTRRVCEDFGFPRPSLDHDEEWRVEVTARLLVTEAAERVPDKPPDDGEKVIPGGPARKRALKLLERWQRDVTYAETFERLARKGDKKTSLDLWARRLGGEVPALSSPAAEEALFEREVEKLVELEDFENLARVLKERESFYQIHAKGFFGDRAEVKVAWKSLLGLARVSSLLLSESGVEREWKSLRDAVEWFTKVGHRVDREGESLFRDDNALPSDLQEVRNRIRRAYLKHLDRCNTTFSELLQHQGIEELGLPFAGSVLAEVLRTREPVAVLVLDACRYDLGAWIAERLNQGEPVPRCEVRAARAPLPSITPIGMSFALASDPSLIRVEMLPECPGQWRITSEDGASDLASAEGRREWLRRRFSLRCEAITDCKRVLDGLPPSPKEAGHLLFVFGDEFDVQGHEGELRFQGAEEIVERYVRAVSRLREVGYLTVVLVTDHGFIYWESERDEVEALPEGQVLWASRRAAVGEDMHHETAINAVVDGGRLQCLIPRSVNVFKTYGQKGFFHGGATLQELIIPVVVYRLPRKAQKVRVFLSPINEITSLRPRVELRPAPPQQEMFGTNGLTTGRQVVVKVIEPRSGRRLFRSQVVRAEASGEPLVVWLEREPQETCNRGTRLAIEVCDADNEDVLDRRDVTLKVDIEPWD